MPWDELSPTYVGDWPKSGGRKKTSKQDRIKYAVASDIAYGKPENRAALLAGYDKTGNWKIDDKLSNRDVVVLNSRKTGEVIVSVRGTDLKGKSKWRDLAEDAGIFLGLSKFGPRNRAINSVVKNAKKKYGDNIVMAGHSLGGRVASDVAEKHGLRGVVYSQGSAPRDFLGSLTSRIKKLAGLKSDKVESHRTRGDLISVSRAADSETQGKTRAGESAHSLSQFVPDDAQIGDGKKKAGAWIAHVKKYRAKHPGMSYRDALKGASKTYKR